MTPEEAENFYEDDEDPEKLFSRIAASRQLQWGLNYIRKRYGHWPVPPYDQGGYLPGRTTP